MYRNAKFVCLKYVLNRNSYIIQLIIYTHFEKLVTIILHIFYGFHLFIVYSNDDKNTIFFVHHVFSILVWLLLIMLLFFCGKTQSSWNKGCWRREHRGSDVTLSSGISSGYNNNNNTGRLSYSYLYDRQQQQHPGLSATAAAAVADQPCLIKRQDTFLAASKWSRTIYPHCSPANSHLLIHNGYTGK